MTKENIEEERPLPGLLATVSAGFELTTRHWWLILLPVILDLFFWLGPRLSVQGLIEQNIATLQQDEALAVEAAGLISQMETLAPVINLFTGLSLPVIGVPVLMSGPTPAETPVVPQVVEVQSALAWFLLFVGFSLVGLFLSAFYFGLIARALQPGAAGPVELLRTIGQGWLRLLGLIITFFIVLFVFYLPLVPLAFILSFISSGMAFMVLLLGLMVLALYLSFALHAIFLNGRSLYQAILESGRLVQQNGWPVISLFLFIVIVTGVSDLLWHQADDGSWLTLVSILGHGFISTALVVATFVFYRDRAVGTSLPATPSR